MRSALRGVTEPHFIFSIGSQVLPQVIDTHSIDLVVIGTHGRTGWRKLILGSVAEKIFRQSSCPVLTVGRNVTRSRVKDDGAHEILFPTDFSQQSRGAEPYVFSAAAKYGARLTLLRVLEHAPQAGEIQYLRRAKKQVESLAQSHYLEKDKIDFMVKIGPPVDVVLRAAAQKLADLIVLGVNARRPLADRLVWPNAYRIVCESLCPVLTVRTEGPYNTSRSHRSCASRVL
jgi:nucleotide-binding universal stress UspA family protein